ncbi:hypothetical protein B0H14DRAFT_3563205 [Mycena olivaceomarginata]|nr:hypothetical protein B0H14DRAFT_3563205 [Mycena olivaceomarginata]
MASRSTTHLPALHWGEGSLLRVLWAERLEKPVITAQTACECDDIAVLTLYSQMVRKPHSRRHNISTLTPNPDVPLEIRAHIHTLYEKAKPAILDQNQTLEGLTQTTTALFTEIWKSAPALNLDGIRGARKALKPAAIPNSVVKLKKVHLMGPTRTPGFGIGIVASVALLAGEYIYELMGLLSVDGNAVHTRLSEIRAADQTVRILCGPLRMLNHDCNPNAEYESITGCELGLMVRTLRSIQPGEEITLRYLLRRCGTMPMPQCCSSPISELSGPPTIDEDSRRKARQMKQLRRNNIKNSVKRKSKAQ